MHAPDAEYETVHFQGRNEREAISKAERTIGINRNNISYKTIKQPTLRWFGRIRAKCVIEVYVPRLPKLQENSEQSSSPGTLEVKNGNLQYSAPNAHGKHPTISPCEGINVYVDGQRIEESTVVFPDTVVTIEEQVIDVKPKLWIEISESDMIAYLHCKWGEHVQFRLKDQPPSTDLTLQAERVCQPSCGLTYDTIMKCLEEAGVIFGIDRDVVDEAQKPDVTFPLPIARGEEPRQPEDDHVEWLFAFGVDDEWFNIDDPYKQSLTSVRQGEVIAVYHRGQQGMAGTTVRGKRLEPRPPNAVPFEAGEGVIIRGDQAVAMRTGHPTYKDGKIQIRPLYVIEGDVDAEKGPIQFEGDVLITGHVINAGKIVANGNVVIQGILSAGCVMAEGSVVIHQGIVKSEIHAGGKNAVLIRGLSILKNLVELISIAIKKASDSTYGIRKMISGRAATTIVPDSLGRKIRHACKELSSIPGTKNESQAIQDLIALTDEVREAMVMLQRDGVLDLHTLLRVHRELSAIIGRYEGISRPSEIVTPHVQHSRLNATGDIHITDTGIYQSSLASGRGIWLRGKKPLLIGSEVSAGTVVEAGEVGSQTAARTWIEVEKGGVVRSKLVHPRTVIKVGSKLMIMENLGRNIEARLNEKGELVI